jgi:hypothetical protein
VSSCSSAASAPGSERDHSQIAGRSGRFQLGRGRLVDEGSLARVASLLHEGNAIDAEPVRLIQRPMTSGHLGEWIAAQVFDIELEASAVAAGIDGRFRSSPLQGRTLNIKWYLKREGLLDTMESDTLDYYLVLTGPPSAAISLTRHHPALVHRGCVSLRCATTSVRAEGRGSVAHRRSAYNLDYDGRDNRHCRS